MNGLFFHTGDGRTFSSCAEEIPGSIWTWISNILDSYDWVHYFAPVKKHNFIDRCCVDSARVKKVVGKGNWWTFRIVESIWLETQSYTMLCEKSLSWKSRRQLWNVEFKAFLFQPWKTLMKEAKRNTTMKKTLGNRKSLRIPPPK